MTRARRRYEFCYRRCSEWDGSADDFDMQNGRPPRLSVSPSDPALAAKAASVPVEQRLEDEDHGVLSDVGYNPTISFLNAD